MPYMLAAAMSCLNEPFKEHNLRKDGDESYGSVQL